MIKTLSDILEALRNKESAILAEHEIKHGPTIGDMYEGLTRDILDRSIPSSLGLKIVEGFVEGLDGKVSNQADVMLVRGEGVVIPYTDKYIWPIQDVLAVFEVKKTLYGDSLKDSFEKMRRVSELHKQCDQRGGYEGKDISLAHKSFAKLTGYYPELSKVNDLSEPLPLLYYAFLMELLGPVRIILGYEGYVDETSLRKGIGDFLTEHGQGSGRGFLSLPSLVVCRNNSVVKLNGVPYSYRFDDYSGWRHVMASNSENPMRLMLEMIWTKISSELNVSLPMDDSLEMEVLTPFLRHKYVEVNNGAGGLVGGFVGDYFEEIEKKSKIEGANLWSPDETSEAETVASMIAAKKGFLDVEDECFVKFASERGTTSKEVVDSLVKKRILGWTGMDQRKARLIENTLLNIFTPTGVTSVSDQSALVGLWVENKLDR